MTAATRDQTDTTGATHAYESLLETLTSADADVVREVSVRVGLPTNRIGEAGIVSDP